MVDLLIQAIGLNAIHQPATSARPRTRNRVLTARYDVARMVQLL